MAMMQLLAIEVCVAISNSKHHQQNQVKSCSKWIREPILIQRAVKEYDCIRFELQKRQIFE